MCSVALIPRDSLHRRIATSHRAGGIASSGHGESPVLHVPELPADRIYDAYVSNDQLEDMLAITNILYSAHKMPKTIVFSLRFVSLQAISDRTTFDWKGWQSGYAAMAGRHVSIGTDGGALVASSGDLFPASQLAIRMRCRPTPRRHAVSTCSRWIRQTSSMSLPPVAMTF